ncbi:hypothetical protein GOBAR_AA00775 [Gossypium barbadense]|uniref:Secreted protein n=2 Tax=Gossypium TaxID=3633 RepID=A0ABR0PLI8_GOSAR|nr:hypothetical protein PVK06_020001 [Gossypium arboreum]PPS19780.1 hypothetical protein GOBAR_AA00775 [Gossypium barbadense]
MCIAFGAGLLQRLLCMLFGIATLRKGCGTPSSLGHGRMLFYGSLQEWLRWNMQNRGSIEWTDGEWPALFAGASGRAGTTIGWLGKSSLITASARRMWAGLRPTRTGRSRVAVGQRGCSRVGR